MQKERLKPVNNRRPSLSETTKRLRIRQLERIITSTPVPSSQPSTLPPAQTTSSQSTQSQTPSALSQTPLSQSIHRESGYFTDSNVASPLSASNANTPASISTDRRHFTFSFDDVETVADDLSLISASADLNNCNDGPVTSTNFVDNLRINATDNFEDSGLVTSDELTFDSRGDEQSIEYSDRDDRFFNITDLDICDVDDLSRDSPMDRLLDQENEEIQSDDELENLLSGDMSIFPYDRHEYVSKTAERDLQFYGEYNKMNKTDNLFMRSDHERSNEGYLHDGIDDRSNQDQQKTQDDQQGSNQGHRCEADVQERLHDGQNHQRSTRGRRNVKTWSHDIEGQGRCIRSTNGQRNNNTSPQSQKEESGQWDSNNCENLELLGAVGGVNYKSCIATKYTRDTTMSIPPRETFDSGSWDVIENLSHQSNTTSTYQPRPSLHADTTNYTPPKMHTRGTTPSNHHQREVTISRQFQPPTSPDVSHSWDADSSRNFARATELRDAIMRDKMEAARKPKPGKRDLTLHIPSHTSNYDGNYSIPTQGDTPCTVTIDQSYPTSMDILNSQARETTQESRVTFLDQRDTIPDPMDVIHDQQDSNHTTLTSPVSPSPIPHYLQRRLSLSIQYPSYWEGTECVVAGQLHRVRDTSTLNDAIRHFHVPILHLDDEDEEEEAEEDDDEFQLIQPAALPDIIPRPRSYSSPVVVSSAIREVARSLRDASDEFDQYRQMSPQRRYWLRMVEKVRQFFRRNRGNHDDPV